MTEPLLFELSKPGRHGVPLPAVDVPEEPIPAELCRDDLDLPEVSEIDVVRHFTRLSQLNYAIDLGFYPLGSCTMKYNPRINEDAARQAGFARLHPYQPAETVQGALELLYELQGYLAEISGFDAVTLQPAAGAHGELCGILIARAYHLSRGDTARTTVIVPDSAHGTNPATAAMAGFQVVTVPSTADGNVDLDRLRALAGPDTAAMMITNPNTLGLWDRGAREIVEIIHGAGGLVYNDGANFNAILGVVKPGEVGFDIMHFNVHKTFSTPHGGGGPGGGPVGVKAHLAPFLPTPRVVRDDGPDGPVYRWAPVAQSIGKLHAFYGNFGVLVRAYTYIRANGDTGLREVSEAAVLNANYLRAHLSDLYDLPYPRTNMHEFVLSGNRQKRRGVKTLDIAKRLIDFGFYPPTIYFPLIVDEALLIEPTETESVETLDAFIAAMRAIAREAEDDPALVTSAPHQAPVTRLDEAGAARRPNLRWRPAEEPVAAG
ncbi:MAG TPA: aminomethyl-transferring glycine dehydrogenase subunit GcvPB [Thermomicrobiales bacterium]|nr:aminomethyl-transferring glycine dehydrogenase subunit GcvPB [Thermomicrobiales bacterium]